MNQEPCIIHELSEALALDMGLRAVWIDARSHRISFSFSPSSDVDSTREKLREIVKHFQPGDVPDCGDPANQWHVACELCNVGTSQSLPDNIRLTNIPNTGVLLEKTDAPLSRNPRHWENFKWVGLRPRVLPTPSDLQNLEEWKKHLLGAGLCGLAGCTGFLLETSFTSPAWNSAVLFCYIVSYLAGGFHPAEEVWERLRKGILDVHFLMLCVAVGAAFIGHWWEGAVLLFLFSLSGGLEEMALARTERDIQNLFKSAPKEATLVSADDNEETSIPVEQVIAGMRLKVRPGELFPVDALVESGESAADESSLTGESAPVEKHKGDTVFSGTLNTWGSIECVVLKPASESAQAKIMRMIREAQDSKAPSQRFTDRFGTGYTYFILGASLLMFLVWWKGMGLPAFFSPVEEQSAFYRAMTLLVVASPCALVLSIPSAILAGIASGARQGVLFRGGSAIEKLSEIDRVAMDKTGTLTTGELEIVAIEAFGHASQKTIHQTAAALGVHSTHPVSRAIAQEWLKQGTRAPEVRNFKSVSGMGVEGLVMLSDSPALPSRMGRRSLFTETWTLDIPEPEPGITEVFVQTPDGNGRILMRDHIRTSSKDLLQDLREAGLHLTMLTGDRREAADLVARSLSLDDVRAELHPDDKVKAIQEWTQKGEKVAMVGDGVNDAPSLAASYVAVGMGVRGSDAALEQSDVVLMRDRLESFDFAYRLSRQAKRIIYQNLTISLGVIILLVISALGAQLPLTLGVIGHEGSTVVVVFNSLRLFWMKVAPSS